MSLYIGGSSALEFWRAMRYRDCVSSTKSKPKPNAAPKAHEIQEAPLLSLGVVSEPLTLIVDNRESRRLLSGATCRVWDGCHIGGSFAKASPGVYVSTPEACFLQMATVLSLVHLVQLGMELCGSYTMQPLARGGFEQREPLSSVETLARYLAKASNVRGVGKARQAIRYIADGSASPAETNVVILLCFPTSLGGYGLPLPLLNKRIDVSSKNQSLTRSSHFKCDLFWPQIKTAVEYDSDFWHFGEDRQAKDAARRNALEAMGVTMVTMTKRQLYDARETDRVAAIVARRLKRYHASSRKGLLAKRHALRLAVLGEPSQCQVLE